MSDSETVQSGQASPINTSSWGPISVAMPLVGVMLAIMIFGVAGSTPGTQAAPVFFIYMPGVLCLSATLGVAAALRGLTKDGRGVGFSIAGLILNLALFCFGAAGFLFGDRLGWKIPSLHS